MDVFLEYLMRKKASGADWLKKLGLVLAALIVCMLVLMFFPLLGNFMAAYTLFAIAAVVYGMVVLMRNFNLEYEYIYTNGDLDIDIVKAQKTRKRMTSLKCKNIELMASDTNNEFKREFTNESISKRFNAVYDPAQGGIYHALFFHDGERMVLTFQPPKKLLDAMKKMNPRCIHIDEADVLKDESAE